MADLIPITQLSIFQNIQNAVLSLEEYYSLNSL